MHLAQLNIARLTHPIDHPATAEFAAGLDPINALAEESPGYVWRLQTDEGDATALRPHPDPDVIINLTVWESPEALKDFVFRSAHTDFLRRRTAWFTPMDGPQVVAWWIEEGHEPTPEEGLERLAHLAANGPSEHAFTVNRPFPAPSNTRAAARTSLPPKGPLGGLLVADFSRVLAGPYAAMTLGDLGADVVKVERPGSGDDTREWGPPYADDVATYYLGLNRNKRSVTFDLSDADDLRLAVELANRADVFIENFRPGTLERFGLGYEQLAVTNPMLVYCSITGFGAATEEARELSGYDLLVQAMSGLMSVTGDAAGEPTKVGVAVVDHITALQATIGILAALEARHTTGRGQRVEVSLMGAALAALINQGSAYASAGVVGNRMGNSHPSVAPYQPFRASDGWFVLACGNDGQFARVAKAVERPELASDPRFATNALRVSNLAALQAILDDAFATRTAAAWATILRDAGVPSGPINDIAHAFETAAQLGIEPIVTNEIDGHVQRTVRSPLRLSETPASVRRNAPHLGEHKEEVRRWLQN